MSELASDDVLYGPSYYPTVDHITSKHHHLSNNASSPLSAFKGGSPLNQQQQSTLRLHVPYLKDLRMSREFVVYQSAHQSQTPPAAAPSSASFTSRAVALGVKTISGLSKSISFAVPAVHNAIAEWDDGSSQRRASGLMGPPVTVGGKPLPSITVSCEEGMFARHFYELKEHREGFDSMSAVSSRDGRSEDELDSIIEAGLAIPCWPERVATPEELAVEKTFADEAGYWQDVYWERISEARKSEEQQELFAQQQQQHAQSTSAVTNIGGSTYGRKSSIACSKPSSYSGGASPQRSPQTVIIAPQPPPNIMHPVSRKPSMPMLQRQPPRSSVGSSTAAAPVGSAASSSTSFPRWNVSHKVENSFRREVGSISSISSSVMEHGSQSSSARTGSLRELRKSSTGQAKVMKRGTDGSAASTTLYPRIIRKTSDAPLQPHGGPAPFCRESPSERKIHGIGRRSASPTDGVNELTCSATVVTDTTETFDDRTDDGGSNVAGPVSSPQTLMMPPAAVETSDMQRSVSSTPDRQSQALDASHPGGAADHSAPDKLLDSEHQRSGHRHRHRGRHVRPPIPWQEDWTLPIAFHIRRVPFASDGSTALVEGADDGNRFWDSSSCTSESDEITTTADSGIETPQARLPEATSTPHRQQNGELSDRKGGGETSAVSVHGDIMGSSSPGFVAIEDAVLVRPRSAMNESELNTTGTKGDDAAPIAEAASSPVAGERQFSSPLVQSQSPTVRCPSNVNDNHSTPFHEAVKHRTSMQRITSPEPQSAPEKKQEASRSCCTLM